MRELSYAQDGDLRRPNDSVAFAVVAQMAAPGNMSDDQDVSPRSFRCPVQQFRNISAVDDDQLVPTSCWSLAISSVAKPVSVCFHSGLT